MAGGRNAQEAVDLAVKRFLGQAPVPAKVSENAIPNTVREMFNQIDHDSKGYLNLADIVYLNFVKDHSKGKPTGSMKELRKSFAKMNTSGTGRVSYEEFYADIDRNIVKQLRAFGQSDAHIVETIDASIVENKAACEWAVARGMDTALRERLSESLSK
jgi:hypothetical protein